MTLGRIEKLRAALAEKEIDGFITSQPENRRYLTGFVGTAGWAIVTRDEALLATDFRYTEQATAQAPTFRVVEIKGGLPQWLPQVMDLLGGALQGKRLAFEGEHLSYALWQSFARTLGERVELAPVVGLVESLRMFKEPEELALMQEAVRVTDEAMARVIPTIQPGQTERQIAWALEVAMRELGAEGLSFDTIVAAGPNAAMAHHRPDDTPIQRGQTIVIDMGCKVNGYCSDQTRTVYIGPQDEQFQLLYDLTLGAQLTAIETIAPGLTGAEGDSLARTVIQDAGYGERFGHGLGHGSGLAVHEEPRVTMGSQQVLKESMVFSIEPGIYVPGWGGIRIEDLVVMEKGGARSLSRAPKTPDWEGALR